MGEIVRRTRQPGISPPEQMPFCPAWVDSRLAFLKYDHQPDSTGKYRLTPTLPCTHLLSQTERKELENYKNQIDRLCTVVPADAEECTLAIVTEMMLVLLVARQNETSIEARGQAYLTVLDDIPPWAVAAGG